jgi:cell division protein FtsQ
MKKVRIILWILFAAGIFVATGFVEAANQDVRCKKVNILIDAPTGNYFLDEKDVRIALKPIAEKLEGRKIRDINTGDVEKLIKNLEPVSSVESFATVDGQLFINISLRKVLLRAIPQNGKGFYIDTTGARMNWLPKYTARVIIATGNFSRYCGSLDSSLSAKNEPKIIRDLFVLGKFFEANEFWKAFTDQVYFNDNGDIEIVPKYGDFKVVLGDVSNLDEKFAKLEKFYNEGLNKENIDVYSEIVLKFKGQIVCKKKA